MTGHANKVSEDVSLVVIQVEMLHEVLAVGQRVEGNTDGSADRPRMVLRKRCSVSSLGSRLRLDTRSVELSKEEL